MINRSHNKKTRGPPSSQHELITQKLPPVSYKQNQNSAKNIVVTVLEPRARRAYGSPDHLGETADTYKIYEETTPYIIHTISFYHESINSTIFLFS
jgi:hypothetical protein